MFQDDAKRIKKYVETYLNPWLAERHIRVRWLVMSNSLEVQVLRPEEAE
jgi:hypothetical protein